MPERHVPGSDAIGAAVRAAAAQVAAPPELRARIARDRHEAGLRRGRRTPLLVAAAAGLVALAVAVFVVLGPAAPPGPPSVAEAARAALAAPTTPAPAVDPRDARFVTAAVAGIRFPNYAYDSPWRAVGGRADALGPRASRTVTYALGPSRVGYTIVDGPALATPPGVRAASASGTPVRVARFDGALVVAWERAGHTCVLASRTASLAQMLRFVAWRGEA
jgi:hypothetical protein